MAHGEDRGLIEGGAAVKRWQWLSYMPAFFLYFVARYQYRHLTARGYAHLGTREQFCSSFIVGIRTTQQEG